MIISMGVRSTPLNRLDNQPTIKRTSNKIIILNISFFNFERIKENSKTSSENIPINSSKTPKKGEEKRFANMRLAIIKKTKKSLLINICLFVIYIPLRNQISFGFYF